MTVLLIDFGASRVKSAILDSDVITDVKSHNSVLPSNIQDKKFEVGIKKLTEQFKKITEIYYKKYKYSAILICSEMHGFVVLDKNNKPLSDYISWKDERCTNKIDNVSTIDLLKEKLGDDFYEITGMNIRPCYPLFNFYHLLRENRIKSGCYKIVSLPEWFCAADGNSLNLSHSTMSAGLGFYNIHTKKVDSCLVNLFNVDLIFNETVDDVKIGGYVNVDGKNIPVYTGVGDHQCAVLGAGNNEKTISLNLGTGSQIAMVRSKNDRCEKRPFFNKQNLSVITHIPSGRCLNVFINFLKEINPDKDFWKIFSEITQNDINNASLNFNLALFSSAWNFSNYGFIKNINEHNLNLKNYLASLIKSYLSQYEKGIEFLGRLDIHEKIILSGGIPLKVPVIKEYFLNKGYNTEITDQKFDETLMGLKKLDKLKSV